MQTIRNHVEYKRSAAFKAPHSGERDAAGDTTLSADHLYSSKARLIAERDNVWREYLRVFNMIKGLELAIELLSK